MKHLLKEPPTVLCNPNQDAWITQKNSRQAAPKRCIIQVSFQAWGLLPQWPPNGRAHGRRSSALLALQWCESRRHHHCACMVRLADDPASIDGLSCCPKDVERSKPQDIIIR